MPLTKKLALRLEPKIVFCHFSSWICFDNTINIIKHDWNKNKNIDDMKQRQRQHQEHLQNISYNENNNNNNQKINYNNSKYK